MIIIDCYSSRISVKKAKLFRKINKSEIDFETDIGLYR